LALSRRSPLALAPVPFFLSLLPPPPPPSTLFPYTTLFRSPLHPRRRAPGRRLAPRRLLRPRARPARGHRRPLAQDHHRGRPGVDAPLPLARSEREGLRRPSGDHAQ